MTTPAIPSDPDGLRISDADRERVVVVLNRALGEGRLTLGEVDERLTAVYAARTFAELRPIVRDLPDAPAAVPPPASTAAVLDGVPAACAPAVVRGAASGHAVAVFGGFERKGAWTVPELMHVTTVMGGGHLDLTRASLSAREVTIQVFALFGGLEIVVPPTIHVIVDTFALFGGVDNRVTEPPPPGAPVVRVTGFAMFGGLSISPPRADRRGRLR